MNIRRIKADIDVAYSILNPANNPTNDEYFIDIAAYHTQQAIEKSLKYFIHNVYGEDDESRKFKTHSISSLIEYVSKFDQNFKLKNKDLVNIALTISSWEASTRYTYGVCSNINEIKYCLKIAERMYNQIFEIETQRIRNDIDKCIADPFYLKNISFENQTKEIIEAVLTGCRNNPGVNPSDLYEYVDNNLKEIINNFSGQWQPTPPNGELVWTE